MSGSIWVSGKAHIPLQNCLPAFPSGNNQSFADATAISEGLNMLGRCHYWRKSICVQPSKTAGYPRAEVGASLEVRSSRAAWVIIVSSCSKQNNNPQNKHTFARMQMTSVTFGAFLCVASSTGKHKMLDWKFICL